jgi:hypothetical protein
MPVSAENTPHDSLALVINTDIHTWYFQELADPELFE